MRHTTTLLTALATLAAAPAQAVVVGYWDFNNQDLSRYDSPGSSGTMAVTLASVAVASYVDETGGGTDLNAQFGQPAGSALRFFDLLDIVEVATIEMTGLDFTGKSNVTLSFDYARAAVGLDWQGYSVEYNLNDGNGWTTLQNIAEPIAAYTTVTADFSGITGLNGNADAGLRIAFYQIDNAVSYVLFDNITVSAVPEPSTWTLLAGGLLGTAVLVRRRRARPA